MINIQCRISIAVYISIDIGHRKPFKSMYYEEYKHRYTRLAVATIHIEIARAGQ